MSDIKDTLNLEEHDMKKLPDMLNVLTILTYIGSAINLLGLVTNFFQDCDKVIDQLDAVGDMDGFLGRYMDAVSGSLVVFCENKPLIMITTLVGLVFCVWGAIQMRNLKKQGFLFYTIGELLPPVVMLILSLSTSVVMAAFGLVIPLIMVILYATQRKHLVR